MLWCCALQLGLSARGACLQAQLLRGCGAGLHGGCHAVCTQVQPHEAVLQQWAVVWFEASTRLFSVISTFVASECGCAGVVALCLCVHTRKFETLTSSMRGLRHSPPQCLYRSGEQHSLSLMLIVGRSPLMGPDSAVRVCGVVWLLAKEVGADSHVCVRGLSPGEAPICQEQSRRLVCCCGVVVLFCMLHIR